MRRRWPAPVSGDHTIMKWKFISAVAIAACVTTACSDSSNPLEPSSLPSAQSPSSPASETSATGPSFCTNLDNCPGGVNAGPPPEASCSMVTSGIEVVVRGSRQSNGAVLADGVGQVPPGTQPAPPGDFVTAPPGVDGNYSVAIGDALGSVANIQGSCPNLQFTAGGTPVVTNGSTKYFGLPAPPPARP
jgi:hypothetical protein